MTDNQKQTIANEIQRLSKIYGNGKDKKGREKTSQNKVATKAGVSSATISQIVNGNWELIKDEMWRKIKIKLRIELDWQTADTTNLNRIKNYLDAAKNTPMSIGFAYDAGAGKSHTFKLYERTTKNVIYIECKTHWTKKSYAKALVIACGLDDQNNTEDNIEGFTDYIAGLENPLIIIDQMDKLKDASMDLFIDFYNDFNTHCGFVLSGVPALEKRIKRGVKNERSGYREVWSRIGRKWISLKELTLSDVGNICKANGLDYDEEIGFIYNNCEGDLRRVKRDVEKYFLKKTIA